MNFLTKIKNIKRFLFHDLISYITFNFFYRKKISPINTDKNYIEGVTVVVTSCNRVHHLERMIQSFLNYNTYKIFKFIIIEDGENNFSELIVNKYLPVEKCIYLYNKKNMGQLLSIDKAYQYVETKYIFHIEEDWEFYEKGFIEESLYVFQEESKLVTLSLRPHDDFTSFVLEKKEKYYQFIKTKNLVWSGICINPGLYSIEKYNNIGGYARFRKERIVVQAYKSLGYYAGISKRVYGYVHHTGNYSSTRAKYKVA